MKVANNVLELIGQTPIVRLNRVRPSSGAEVYLKLEMYNPGGSVKDRPALNMILQAERDGHLGPGSIIIEPTSGNTGIGIAMVAAIKGYPCIICLPETASEERVSLLKAYGAEVIQTPAAEGMSGAVSKAHELGSETPHAFIPQQFENTANPDAHRNGTALEIVEQMGERLDGFVASAGTGGTITGNGEVLRQNYPGLRIMVVEPSSSPVLSGGIPGPHKIPGMGPGFIPKVLNRSVYDWIHQIKDKEAWDMTRRLAREEGLLVGLSTGAVVCGVLKLAEELGPGKRVLGIAPDTGERYLTTGVFSS